MEFITKNLKQAGIFNTALIIIGIVYDVVRIFSISNTYSLIAIVLQLFAYCAALNYAFKGYKKDAAKSYRHFLYAFALSIIATMISASMRGKAPMRANICAFISLVCVMALAYTKDIGKTRSYAFALVALASSVINLAGQLIRSGLTYKGLLVTLSEFILCMVLFVFVIAKYRDKQERGTK